MTLPHPKPRGTFAPIRPSERPPRSFPSSRLHKGTMRSGTHCRRPIGHPETRPTPPAGWDIGPQSWQVAEDGYGVSPRGPPPLSKSRQDIRSVHGRLFCPSHSATADSSKPIPPTSSSPQRDSPHDPQSHRLCHDGLRLESRVRRRCLRESRSPAFAEEPPGQSIFRRMVLPATLRDVGDIVIEQDEIPARLHARSIRGPACSTGDRDTPHRPPTPTG